MRGQRNRPDHFTRRAKREGSPARSIYKLEEIDKRWQLIRQGAHVLDLGAAPGSWLQYAARRVGPKGLVEGYDLKPIALSLPEHVQTYVGDAFGVEPKQKRYDVVLSDMAPSTIGNRQTDAIRSANLAERALDLADQILEPGGHVVVKVLEGHDVIALVARMRQSYVKVERLRPQATRRESTEIFLIGLQKKAA